MAQELDPDEARLNELIAKGRKTLSEAENPNTPSPLELQMQTDDPERAAETPSMPTGPIGSEQKAKDVEEKSTFAKWGDKQVAGDRVFASEALRGFPETVAAKIKGTTREQEAAETELARLKIGETADSALSFAGQVAPYLLLPNKGGLVRATAEAAGAGLADLGAKSIAENRIPDADEAILTAVFSAGGGAFGNAVGRGAAGAWSKWTNGRSPLPANVRLGTERAAKAVDEAGKAMDRSGLMIKDSYLKALSSEIERKFPQVTPEGTPGAYQVKDRIMAFLATGKDLPIREVDNLRKGIYGTKAKSFEKDIVNDMYGTLNRFIKALPDRPGAVAAGDVKAGVKGWKDMNYLHQDKLRMDDFSGKMAIAEMKARTGKKSVDQAFQEEFGKWFTTPKGIQRFENLYGGLPEKTQALLQELAEGSNVTKTLNKLDKTWGTGWVNTLMRAARSSVAHSAAGPAARQAAGEAFGALPGGIPPGMNVSQGISRVLGAGSISGAQQPIQDASSLQSLGGLMAPKQ